MATLEGIDISHYQSGLSLAKAGKDFAIMKATEGTGYVDDHCDGFYQEAKALGMGRGVYHFYRGNPTSEADFFLRQVGGYVGDGVLVLDFEDQNYLHDVAGAKTWLDRVYGATGIKPLLYMSRSFLTSSNWQSVVDADYGLWLARYSSEPGSVSPWPGMAMWQYTSSGRVNGYGGNVDLDTFYGDRATWDAYAGGSSSIAPGPDPDPTPLIQGDDMFTVANNVAGSTNEGTWWIVVPQGDGKPRATVLGQQDVLTGVPHVQFKWGKSWEKFQGSVEFC